MSLCKDGVWSEVSLYHPEDARYFLNCDETQHPFTTAGNKGGSTTTRYSNPSFPRSGERGIENSRHTSGLYTVNLFGEVLPPLYIFDSKAKEEANFTVDSRNAVGLPEVTGIYGLYRPTCFSSGLSVRKKGGTDTSLWAEYNEKIIKPCYPRMSKHIVRCPRTNKLLQGPLILKTDAGPGRLSKQADSWEARWRWHNEGLVILLGLPNGTSATQEMDQGYAVLKRETKASTVRVARFKMAARVAARKKAMLNKAKASQVPATRANSTVQSVDDVPAPDLTPTTIEDLDNFLAGNNEESDDEDAICIRYKGSVCNITLGNKDLPNIVNGYPNDPVKLRPFDKTFTRENIVKWWKAVGFLPMNRNALNDPKVRWESGEGGAPKEATERIDLLEKDYKEGAQRLSKMGFNGEVLDLKLPRVEETVLPDGEEAQIEALVKAKATNSAGGMFKIGIHIINGRAMLKAKERLDQIEEDAKAEDNKGV